jgi:hypothetical protein
MAHPRRRPPAACAPTLAMYQRLPDSDSFVWCRSATYLDHPLMYPAQQQRHQQCHESSIASLARWLSYRCHGGTQGMCCTAAFIFLVAVHSVTTSLL